MDNTTVFAPTETMDQLRAAAADAAQRAVETGQPSFIAVGDIKTPALDTPAPFTEPAARPFPTVPVIAGTLIGLAVTVTVSWLGYRSWQRRKAAAAEALEKETKKAPPRPAPVAAATA